MENNYDPKKEKDSDTKILPAEGLPSIEDGLKILDDAGGPGFSPLKTTNADGTTKTEKDTEEPGLGVGGSTDW